MEYSGVMTGILILSAVLALGGVVVWIALLLWAAAYLARHTTTPGSVE